MVCRSPSRAFSARDEIIATSSNPNVHVLICDCGLEANIRKTWQDFLDQSATMPGGTRLDGLVCNAGVLLNERTLTSEGVEVTFATHLLFGTYLLTTLAVPVLSGTADSRVIVVSSGGMYNSNFPKWEVATSTGPGPYDGQFAYVYAKRGQVLLCERLSAKYPAIRFVSCHPGWTQTEAVDAGTLISV